MRKSFNTISPKLIEYVKSYYSNNLLDLSPISEVKFRHFRFRLCNGSFYKVKRKIRNNEDLREFLIEYTPLDVYYSTACWLNPHLIASKLDKDILRNVILSCDLAFDIDVNKDVKNLEEARINALKLSDFLLSEHIDIRYIAFSGSKGFHIICEDPWKQQCIDVDPHKREALAVERRKEFIKAVKERGIFFDEKVTTDTRRIIRAPGTINSKTGNICTVISKKLLDSDLETIFKFLRIERSNTPRIPHLLREMTSPSADKISEFLGRLGVRPRLKPTVYYSTFISNNIPGTRLKIPVMEFGAWSKLENITSKILEAQKHYGLGDVAILKDDSKYSAISLKAMSQRRVEKVLSNIESLNLNQCMKYGCTYTRMGKSIDYDGKALQDEPEFIIMLESDLKGQVSRAHYEFFVASGIRFSINNIELCGSGKEEIEIVHAIIE
jgi:DNA primase catalytic subunit